MKIEDCYVGMRVVRSKSATEFINIGDSGIITKITHGGKAIKVALDGSPYKELVFFPEYFDPIEEIIFDFDLSFDDLMSK